VITDLLPFPPVYFPGLDYTPLSINTRGQLRSPPSPLFLGPMIEFDFNSTHVPLFLGTITPKGPSAGLCYLPYVPARWPRAPEDQEYPSRFIYLRTSQASLISGMRLPTGTDFFRPPDCASKSYEIVPPLREILLPSPPKWTFLLWSLALTSPFPDLLHRSFPPPHLINPTSANTAWLGGTLFFLSKN